MKIAKRSGNFVMYDDEKVVRSILRANEGTGEALSAIERQDSFHEMMEVALKAAVRSQI